LSAEKAREQLPAELGAVNASLLSSIDAPFLQAVASASDLDLSFSDLSSGTSAEVEATAAVDELALRRSELEKAKFEYGEAHKEKDFAKIQEKKKAAKSKQEATTAAISTLEQKLAKLNAKMDSAPWSVLIGKWKTACPTRLSLKTCGLTAYALAQLRPVLAPHVKTLLLDGNDLGDRGAEEVTELLAECTCLEHLAVRNCSFSDLGMGTLAAGVARSKALQTLDVRQNALATGGAAEAFLAVQRFRAVKCLL
jgi:polyhydroxyalkanoate synthesis regulator phasin